MLLEDLVSPEIRRSNYNGTFKKLYMLPKGVNDNTRAKRLGSGTQASVKDDPNDPHMVKKHNHVTYDRHIEHGRTNDGFNRFVEWLIRRDYVDNVHFPRVYNIKTITDKGGRHIHSYTMEKLIPIQGASPEEMEAFVEKSLHPGAIKPAPKSNYMNARSYVYETMDLVCNVLTDAFMHGEFSGIKSESLLEACEIMGKFVRAEGVDKSDLGPDNMMWRRTSTGLVLVLSDPFY